jgi:hypothetical protein
MRPLAHGPLPQASKSLLELPGRREGWRQVVYKHASPELSPSVRLASRWRGGFASCGESGRRLEKDRVEHSLGSIRMHSIRDRGPLSPNSYERQIAELRDQLEQAQETILQLEQILEARGINQYKGVKLTKNQQTIVDMLLMTDGTCTNKSLYAALYSSKEGYKPSSHVIRENVRVIRKQLKPHGINIENVHGIGYMMTSENRIKLGKLIINR